MIIKKKYINRVLRDAMAALLLNADTAFCTDSLVNPEQIKYRNTEIALPKQLGGTVAGAQELSYDIRLLCETLVMMRDEQMPAYLQKLATVPADSRQINVGAVVRQRAADRRLVRNRTPVVLTQSRSSKGKRKL